MTPTQHQLIDYIRLRQGRLVNSYELRDAIMPGRHEANVKVQIHRARAAGERRIETVRGQKGGYRWSASA
jgi:hypothetical protein